MVQPVKSRTHDQPFQGRTEPQAHVGMCQAFEKLGCDHDGKKLAGAHADDSRHCCQDDRAQHVVEQVVAMADTQVDEIDTTLLTLKGISDRPV